MNLNRSHCNFNKLLTLYNLSSGVALRLKEATFSRCPADACKAVAGNNSMKGMPAL